VSDSTEQSSQDGNTQVRDSGLSGSRGAAMTPSQAAEVEAKKTFEGFIKWLKVSFYWIMAILVILAWFNFGADTETGSQYNGEVYEPTNIGEK